MPESFWNKVLTLSVLNKHSSDDFVFSGESWLGHTCNRGNWGPTSFDSSVFSQSISISEIVFCFELLHNFLKLLLSGIYVKENIVLKVFPTLIYSCDEKFPRARLLLNSKLSPTRVSYEWKTGGTWDSMRKISLASSTEMCLNFGVLMATCAVVRLADWLVRGGECLRALIALFVTFIQIFGLDLRVRRNQLVAVDQSVQADCYCT